jgi:gamma-glutamylputrescine oxidase
MNTRNLKYDVFWYLQKPAAGDKQITPLAADLSCDVVIVGAGMAGLTAANIFQKAGKSVILIERDFCGAGASGKTSGFITPDSEIELSLLVANFGPEKAKVLWDFVTSGVETIRKNILEHNLDCDYQVQNSLFVATTPKGAAHTVEEHEAREGLGYGSTLYDKQTVQQVIGSKKYFGAVEYPETFGMNSYLFCRGMKEVLERSGVQIFEGTKVTQLFSDGVMANGYRIRAKHVLVCTDRFTPQLGKLKKDIFQIQTFLMVSEPLPPETIATVFPQGKKMVWDTDLIYQYYRMTGDNRMLIGGGDFFWTYRRAENSKPSRFYKRLLGYLKKHFPTVNFDVEYIWPGFLGVSQDFVPILCCDKQHDTIHFIGAASGLPWAAALADYTTQKILTGRNDLDSYFSPDRKLPLPDPIRALLGVQGTFAISHGLVKYFK